MTRDRHPAALATLAALTALLALAAPRPAQAASAADALAGRIPPISGRLHSKAGRLELTPTANLSLNDAFFSKYLFGLKAGWHFSELLSVHGAFVTGFSSATDSTQVCRASTGCRPASDAQLDQVPGELKRLASVEVGLSPIYGKVNVFAEKVLHFDLSLFLGADWVTHRAVISAAEAAAGVSPGDRDTFGAHVGVGARIFMGRSLALRLEVKDVLYRVPVLGETTLQNQLFTELGLSIFLPGTGSGRAR